MPSRSAHPPRRGAVLPLIVICLVGMFAFVAMAVNVGLLVDMRTQCQGVADLSAMAAARTLNGLSGNNYDNAVAAGKTAAKANSVLKNPVQDGQVAVTIGKYYYDSAQAKFVLYPDETSTNPTTENWTLAKSTVTVATSGSILPWFGMAPASISATATAVHRPRDVAIVLDFSGSMRFASLLGIPHSGSRQSNNPESVYPQFGHYSSTSAALRNSADYTVLGSDTFDAANTTASETQNDNRTAVVTDFYQAAGTTAAAAFTSAGDGDSVGYVAGDKPLKGNFNAGSSYAQTVKDVLNGSTSLSSGWESNGYGWSSLTNRQTTFSGYTRGPRYWGKTFFLWPPDPRTHTGTGDARDNGANDWRKRFFYKTDGTTAMDDNTLLWDSAGNWRSPSYYGSTAYYKINYRAVLYWLQNTGTNPFPTQVRAGRILYYDAFPDVTDSTLNTRFWAYNPSAPSGLSSNERFWKEYIDFVLGVLKWDSDYYASTTYPSMTQFTGYGDDFAWGTVSISAKPSDRYMSYTDNPKRPKTHFWFGPMTMADFLGCYNMANLVSGQRFNWWPGTAHEAPLYACKLGIQAAISDIEDNHPNDSVALIYFSNPRTSAADVSGRFNRPRVPLGRQYQRMKDSLWFPPSTLSSYNSSSPPRPFDTDNGEVPRAWGSTCYAMGLMLAYNQFSGNSDLRSYNPGGLNGDAGGLGRRGARRLVIFETDGLPNTTATASFTKQVAAGGENQSYYQVRCNSTTPSSSEFPASSFLTDNDATVTSEIYSVANRICALETATNPGFATTTRPVRIHCIGFGPVFDASSADRTGALTTLQQVEVIGGVQSAATDPPTLASYKIITGADSTVTSNLRTAIQTIMQDGVQVSLIR